MQKTQIEFNDNFTVECLGEYEETVYDIEVEDNHNFFANNICVHNSLYVNMEDLVKLKCQGMDDQQITDWLDKFSKKMTRVVIDKACDNLASFMNCKENKMIMDREAIAKTAFWRAKKNYAVRVMDMEGVRGTFTKIMGMETQKGGTPEAVKKGLTLVINAILDDQSNQEVVNIIDKFDVTYRALSFDDISLSKSCKSLSKYDSKGPSHNLWHDGCPGHVRGALTYNDQVKQAGLTSKFPLIKNGDSVKLLQLQQPNPFGCNQIAYADYLSPELTLINDFIDRHGQYEKTFLSPAESMCEAVGYSTVIVSSLF